MAGDFYNKYSNISSNYVDAVSLNNLTAFFPEKHYAYGPKHDMGPNTTYTNDFVQREDINFMKALRTPFFGKKPLLVLTNGNCFSSCAIFTHVLKRHFGLIVVTVGGIPKKPIAISASCVGFTTPSFNEEILLKAQQFGLKNYPPPFQVKVDLGYAASAMYVSSDVPCEFKYMAPDHRIFYDNDNVASLERVWKDAAQHFPAKGMPRKIDYSHDYD